jgi:hypothetical protein
VVAASADRADVSSITRAAHVLVRFVVRSFSTNSRPALRAAACGGRPRPARRDGHREQSLPARQRRPLPGVDRCANPGALLAENRSSLDSVSVDGSLNLAPQAPHSACTTAEAFRRIGSGHVTYVSS